MTFKNPEFRSNRTKNPEFYDCHWNTMGYDMMYGTGMISALL